MTRSSPNQQFPIGMTRGRGLVTATQPHPDGRTIKEEIAEETILRTANPIPRTEQEMSD
jgi:hypothetical protein